MEMWIFILLCHVYHAKAECSEDGSDVFRICENKTSEFTSANGDVWIEPDDIEKLTFCACTIRPVDGPTSLTILTLGHSPDPGTGTNISITNGNQNLPLKGSIEIDQIQRDVTLSFQHSAEDEHKHKTYCYHFYTRGGKEVSLNCSTSFRPEGESSSSVSIGVILGPTITIFILVDIGAVGLVYYILKRRMRLKKRSSFSDRRDQSKNDGSERPRGNNYVGIRSQSSADDRHIQAVGDGYEDVAQQGGGTSQAQAEPPQKKRGWFNFGRSQNAVADPFQPEAEYEEVVEPQKKRIPRSPKVCQQTPSVPEEVDWTPADEYEDVEVGVPTSGSRKDHVSKAVNSPIIPKARTPKTWARKSMKPSKEDDLQPTDCYEEMNTVYPEVKGKLRRTDALSEKKGMTPQAKKTASPVLQKHDGRTEGNITPTQKKKRPSISPKPKASLQPTDVYDNAEMFLEPPSASRPTPQRKPLVPKRVRTVTEPPNPNQIYDNFDRIMEVEKSRANSVKK